jgi:hypothetical protein
MTLTANQFVLLAALNETIHPMTPPLLGVRLPREGFASQREWLGAAHALYLKLWPGGSNPQRGPRAAIPSVLRHRWVVQVPNGRALAPVLTAVGAEVVVNADPSTIRPKYVLDYLADMRRRSGELGPVDTNPQEEEA